jgi:hypothetical protein
VPLHLAHKLHKTGDYDNPHQITDANGQVVLALCRKCGRGEAELDLDEGVCPKALEIHNRMVEGRWRVECYELNDGRTYLSILAPDGRGTRSSCLTLQNGNLGPTAELFRGFADHFKGKADVRFNSAMELADWLSKLVVMDESGMAFSNLVWEPAADAALYLRFLEKVSHRELQVNTEQEGFALECAMQNGFESIQGDGNVYAVHSNDLIDFILTQRRLAVQHALREPKHDCAKRLRELAAGFAQQGAVYKTLINAAEQVEILYQGMLNWKATAEAKDMIYTELSNKGPESRCEVPPEGWTCTREAGHDGPCAALPSDRAQFRDLPKGARFRYLGADSETFVVLSTAGRGEVAQAGVRGPLQGIYSFGDDCTQVVEVVQW